MLSTAVNLLLSMIPLLIVVVVTRAPITKVYLLIPFVIFCLVLFCIGMSFLLSSAMVFFSGYSVFVGSNYNFMDYATPLFYPESILPEHLKFILDFNPMYHYVTFIRKDYAIWCVTIFDRICVLYGIFYICFGMRNLSI